MSVLSALVEAIGDQTVEVIDLTAPLNASTPVIRLPEPFGNTRTFALHEISRYDDRGPAWYWNDISTGEHTGTHFDAPVHWVTGADLEDVAQVPAARLLAPAAVLDFAAEAAADPDFLLEVDHIKQWESEHGPLPEGGWLLYRTGWDARADSQEAFLNANETGPHTPGHLGGVRPLAGRRRAGARDRGGDRGHRRRDRALLRPAVPLPLVAARGGQVRPHPAAQPGPAARAGLGGDRRPAADHRRLRQPVPGAGPGRILMLVADAVADALAGLGADTVFGLVGSGNFHVTNGLTARGARFVAARHECGAASMADGWARLAGRPGLLSVHQGPGLTNALTGITEAAKSRTPLVVLAADVAGAAVRSNFRIDAGAIAAAVGAVPERLYSPAVGGGRRGARLPDGGPPAPDRAAGHAAGRAGRAVRSGRGAGRAAAVAACPRAGGGGRAGRRAGRRQPAGVRGRPGRAHRGRAPGPGGAGRRPAARCWPPRPRPRACSAAARGTST